MRPIALGPRFVVIASPLSDHGTRMGEGVEVVVIEALVPELAVKALDKRILRRLASSDQLEADSAAPSAGERLPYSPRMSAFDLP